MTTHTNVFTHMDDRPLLDAAKQLASDERRATAALLRVLMEIDSRRLYLGEGCASMFSYCTQVLHLAEGAAYNRIEAARAARSYPLILELFEQSAITLTAVRLLAPHLTVDNHGAVLASAKHKSKREIEELVSSLKPKPDAPVVVRKLPTPESCRWPPGVRLQARRRLQSSRFAAVATAKCDDCSRQSRPPASRPSRRSATGFSSPSRARRTTSSGAPRRCFATRCPRATPPRSSIAPSRSWSNGSSISASPRPRDLARATPSAECSRHIPAAVRRAVWRRDAGRCAFVGAEGRCAETAFLEFHHVEPYAAGGEATVQNIELRCRAHNAYEARLFFGDDVVREEQACWG